MQTHPLIGVNILAPIEFPWDILPIVRHHHERFDGLGYPAGLKGGRIPLGARILAVADAFEAMISARPYRKARPPEDALEELQRNAGTQFDPSMVKAFAAAFKKGKVELPGEPEARAGILTEGAKKEAVKEVFAGMANSLLKQYARISGPRLKRKLEGELREAFRERGLDVSRGKVGIGEVSGLSFKQEISLYRDFLQREASLIERAVGRHILEYFLSVSLGDLSERLKPLAEEYGFNKPI